MFENMFLTIITHMISKSNLKDLGELDICDPWSIQIEVRPFEMNVFVG